MGLIFPFVWEPCRGWAGRGNGYFRLLHHSGGCGDKGRSLLVVVMQRVNLCSHFLARRLEVLPTNTPAFPRVIIRHRQIVMDLLRLFPPRTEGCGSSWIQTAHCEESVSVLLCTCLGTLLLPGSRISLCRRNSRSPLSPTQRG